jgi:hypothetical protein
MQHSFIKYLHTEAEHKILNLFRDYSLINQIKV